MHFALQFLPIFYALGTVYFLQSCCPGASSSYSWFNCDCPTAQFTWTQQRKQGTLCGYPELTAVSSPPVYYKTLTWSGGMTQVVNYRENDLSGSTAGESESIFGVTIPANCDYSLVVNQFETWINIVTGTDTMSPPDVALEDDGSVGMPCAEVQAAVISGTATLTTVVTGTFTPTTGPDAGMASPVNSTTTTAYGPGSWGYLASSATLLWGSLIDVNHLPPGIPNITDDTSYGGITAGITGRTSQVFIGNDTLTGEIDQVISNAVDEATVLAAASANSVTFDGGVMGGGGGWNAQSGASDYPSTVGLDGPGGGTDGVDYCGPAWADRTGRQVDQIAATFGIKVSNLVAGVPMKCTVQAYRAAYSVDVGNPLTPSFGTPEPVGAPIVFNFTPSGDTYTIGPGEHVISGDAPQGWIYGAKIVGVEPA